MRRLEAQFGECLGLWASQTCRCGGEQTGLVYSAVGRLVGVAHLAAGGKHEEKDMKLVWVGRPSGVNAAGCGGDGLMGREKPAGIS